jgi:hypothetical protein
MATRLETVLTNAQATLSELQANFEVTVLRTQALNDDRHAFDRIKAIISEFGPAANLALESSNHILSHLDRTNWSLPSIGHFFKSEYFFKGQFHTMSLEELHTVYQRLPYDYRPSYLTMLCKEKRFTKLELLSTLANVAKTTDSLHELYRACGLISLEANTDVISNCQLSLSYYFDSPPYTFFLLNGDMELYRDRQLFVEKMFQDPQSQLAETSITALPTMNNLSPSLCCT